MHTLRSLPRSFARPSLRRLGERFRRDRRGVSAVEFALILPIMLAVYFGGFEVSEGVTIKRKVTHVTSSLGDLVAQARTISNADMTNILNAASAVMNPYPVTTLKIVVTGVAIDSKGKATVSWSDGRNMTAHSKGAAISVPAGIADPSSFLVMTEVYYTYQPKIGYVLTGSITFEDKAYLRPRLDNDVKRTN